MDKVPQFIQKLLDSKYQLIETHISYVIITPKYTYKIKKRVKFNFVDYSSFAKRKHFCFEEIKLNKRYSPEIYIKVVPIKQNIKGKIASI